MEVMDIRKLLGANLVRLRNGRPQAEVAEACGFEIGSLSRWENGKAWASSETIERLADYYKVDASEIYRGEGAQEPLPMPVSKTLQRLMAIPDYVYDAAIGVDIDDKIWRTVEDYLNITKDDKKSSSLLEKG